MNLKLKLELKLNLTYFLKHKVEDIYENMQVIKDEAGWRESEERSRDILKEQRDMYQQANQIGTLQVS